jgi:pimeloyl-ACP methyl ester carboxylesterase
VKQRLFRAVKSTFLLLAVLLALGIVALIFVRLYAQHKVAAKTRITSAAGIASIEKVKLGGVDQWIEIRGEDRAKPILLFLHGGPGFPQMPFAHLNADLEKHFVVVQWDQRGAGKSYGWSSPNDTMRVAQFVSDTHEMTQLLLRRFNAPKCYLVAHSWGSLFGALTAACYPELFYAYVSIGQVALLPETQQVRYNFALDCARNDNNTKAVAELTRIGPPPHNLWDHCKVMEKWVNHYSAEENQPIAPSRFFRLAFASPAYSWPDLVKIPFGFSYSFKHLWREIFYELNLFDQAPRIQPPVYFLLGRHDTVVTTDVVQNYFDQLDAPGGKQMIWFENSGHWPHFTEAEKYRDVLVNKGCRRNKETCHSLGLRDRTNSTARAAIIAASLPMPASSADARLFCQLRPM